MRLKENRGTPTSEPHFTIIHWTVVETVQYGPKSSSDTSVTSGQRGLNSVGVFRQQSLQQEHSFYFLYKEQINTWWGIALSCGCKWSCITHVVMSSALYNRKTDWVEFLSAVTKWLQNKHITNMNYLPSPVDLYWPSITCREMNKSFLLHFCIRWLIMFFIVSCI